MIIEQDVSRRTFLKLVGGAGAGFALGSFVSLGCTPATAEGTRKKGGAPFIPHAFVKVEPDGWVTVTVSRSDMGQGVRTSFAMLVAEEMDADWRRIKVVQAPGNSSEFSGRGTGGSSSTISMHTELRRIGAGARVMLIGAAAKQWGVDPSTCTTEHGKVLHAASNRSIDFGDLTTQASAMPVPPADQLKLKDPSTFTLIGKPTNRIDNPDVVSGKAKFGIDVKLPGMKYAAIARAPSFGATLKNVDDADARKVVGVVDVFKIDHGVAVLATDTWAAFQGKENLKLTWDPNPNADIDTPKLRDRLKGALIDHPAPPAGAKVVEAQYELPYLAHATMEPMNAVADVRADRCDVWVGTQSPDGAAGMVASMLKLPPESVTINVMLLGGGFGRRGNVDYVSDAVQVSKAAKCPVKVTWTREDDTKHDYYRPMSHHSLKGAVDGNGAPVAWSHQEIQAGGRGRGSGAFENANLPYAVPGAVMRRSSAESPVPNGAWRSVEHSQVVLANECFIDEMAHAAGQDPYEFRMKYASNPRLKKVLETAAKAAGWGSPLPAGSGRGIACFDGYGSCVAHVVELSVAGDKVKLHRVVAAVDVGQAVNPRGVEAQIQSGCCDGLTTALRAGITIKGGAVEQSSWDDYPWMTLDAMPAMEVIPVQGSKDFGGMGELGVPSTAPAVANALFVATGKRVRKFPIKLEELV